MLTSSPAHKLTSFLAFLSLIFSSSTSFAASSSFFGASALGEISIGLSDYDELAAKCLDIFTYENSTPDICAEFIDESLELAINSSYRFEDKRPEVRGSGNSQTIAAQINYDAKQSYLLSKEQKESAKQVSKDLGYRPNEVVYVSASTTEGVSVKHKGIEVANSENKDHGGALGRAVLFIAVAAGVAAVFASSSSPGAQSEALECEDGYALATINVREDGEHPLFLTQCVPQHVGG